MASKNDPSLNPALRDFWLTPARYRILYGGRASSKSWDAAGFAVFLAQAYKIKVMCTRRFQNRIDVSVYSLLKIQIERFGLSDVFDIQKTRIICKTTGSEFIFFGIARNFNDIKGTEGVDIHWAEEAEFLTEEEWKVIDITLRGEGSQHWIVFNPQFATDFVYRRFVTNKMPNSIVRHINYNENPFLSSTALAVINAAKSEDEEAFSHIYLGHPKDNDDESIIKRSWVMASIDAHVSLGIVPAGESRIGFDVADAGEDLCAMVHSRGGLNLWSDMWQQAEDELMQGCRRVWAAACERSALVAYDSVGVGAFVGSKLDELNQALPYDKWVQHARFHAGAGVVNPDGVYGQGPLRNRDMFQNNKPQAWVSVADRFKETYNAVRHGAAPSAPIFIDADMPNLTKLIDELVTPRKRFDGVGRVVVETKLELKKRGIKSPNLADAFIMANMHPSILGNRTAFL